MVNKVTIEEIIVSNPHLFLQLWGLEPYMLIIQSLGQSTKIGLGIFLWYSCIFSLMFSSSVSSTCADKCLGVLYDVICATTKLLFFNLYKFWNIIRFLMTGKKIILQCKRYICIVQTGKPAPSLWFAVLGYAGHKY